MWTQRPGHLRKARRSAAKKHSRAVSIDGVAYPSVTAAAIALSLNDSTVHNRLRSDKWPHWVFSDVSVALRKIDDANFRSGQ